MIVAFVFLAAMSLVCALGVVLSRNVIHSALFMSASFLGVAGFFVMLNAPALAAFQVLIYVGAVTVVILFGIMFTQRPSVSSYRTIIQRQHMPGLVVAAGLAVFLSYIVSVQEWGGQTEPGQGPQETATFGENLLGVGGGPEVFGLFFQVTAVLLMISIVAAVVISRRKTDEGD